MATATRPAAAIHLAVLVDTPPGTPSGQASAVLVYDGCGWRHHHVLDPPLPADRLALTTTPQHGQLRLPLEGGTAAPTSSGLGWRTFVLPSIPTALRVVPRDRLAAAFAALLSLEAEGRS